MNNPYYEKLVSAALRFVSFRPRSEKELRDFLLKKPNHEDVEKVIERMRELGYVDDRKFADWWVSQRSLFRPKGKRVIEYELRKKGVTLNVSLDEYTLAKKALAKKSGLWASLPRNEYKKKVYTFLTQRGFSGDVIGQVIDGKGEKE